MSKFIRLNVNKPQPPYNKVSIGIISILIGFILVYGIGRQNDIKAQLHAWRLLPEPETLTEAYFEDHLKLPQKVVKGSSYPFRFTIHNLEYKDTLYTYEVTVIEADNKENIASGSVSLKHDEYKTIDASFSAQRDYGRTKIEVNLLGRNQPIHFWMDGQITLTPTVTPKTKTTQGIN